ncbi:hypothetical protein [Falsigemmobacter faecalis]|uniref:Uncharacterized protein n=1 Tax=Falsigemmobacter faecalis TaxID=2488730 RepID=A0A3P3DQ73_9RHOB|nr:hypothetical protein [Falsigemmobacter faecalis]RRH76390.1 hypothetical protein EG244_06445 [Falsigemmobacter faecalis]
MLRIFHLLLAGTLIAFVAVPALARPPEAVKLAEAMEANGCVANNVTIEAITKASGLSNEQGMAAAQALLAEGLVVEDRGGYRLVSPACDALLASAKGEALAPAVAALTVAIRANDCRMTPGSSEAIVEHSNLIPDAAEEAVQWMIGQGQLIEAGEDLQLKTEGCL